MKIKRHYKQPALPVKKLQEYHSLFYALAQLGDPAWNDKIETAAVHYNPTTKRIDWDINPDFWDSLTDNERAFVVCHEAMHVMLDHPARIKRVVGEKLDKQTIAQMNICVDVAVNEQLLRSYGFDKRELPTIGQFLADADFLMETVKEDKIVELLNQYSEFIDIDDSDSSIEDLISMGNMEFFKDLLLSAGGKCEKQKNGLYKMTAGGKDEKNDSKSGKGESDDEKKDDEEESGNSVMTLDVHEDSENDDGQGQGQGSFEDALSNIAESIQDLDMHEDQKEEALEELRSIARQAGLELGPGFSVPRPKYKPKPKWESIIKRWIRKTIDEFARTDDNWFGDKRQMSWMEQLAFVQESGIMLPGEDRESTDIHKIPVLLFLDTSGSCYSYAARFIQAALSFPKEYFDVEVWGFTTVAYKIDYTKRNVKLKTGGTRFDILETVFRSKKVPPSHVFVITDGYGNHIMPKNPERWTWFLTDIIKENRYTGQKLDLESQIPQYIRHLWGQSKFYDLSDFE